MAKATTLDDIAESIADLTQMMAGEFSAVRQEMVTGFAVLREEMRGGDEALREEMKAGEVAVRQEMVAGFAEVHRNQRETNKRLDKLELATSGLDEDVRELYQQVEKLRKDFNSFSAAERDRFGELEAFAMQVAEKTGIPYHPSNSSELKRRS